MCIRDRLGPVRATPLSTLTVAVAVRIPSDVKIFNFPGATTVVLLPLRLSWYLGWMLTGLAKRVQPAYLMPVRLFELLIGAVSPVRTAEFAGSSMLLSVVLRGRVLLPS